jgi:hypothetical protein
MMQAESKAYANKELRNYTECLKVLLLDETQSFKESYQNVCKHFREQN